MKRILVIGSTGVGKTTLAINLAQTLNLNHIELDSLFWGPDWTPTPKGQFKEKLALQMASNQWVIDGNYSFARELIWPQADTAVWLDYPLPIILWRLFRRTLRRTFNQEHLWNGNQERFTNQFLSSDSLFLYAIKSKKKHRLQYPQLFNSPDYAHLQVIHHHSPKQTSGWLETLTPC
jgi:adenylate kinase family enzyme